MRVVQQLRSDREQGGVRLGAQQLRRGGLPSANAVSDQSSGCRLWDGLGPARPCVWAESWITASCLAAVPQASSGFRASRAREMTRTTSRRTCSLSLVRRRRHLTAVALFVVARLSRTRGIHSPPLSPAASGRNIVAISGGEHHTLALTGAGEVLSLGALRLIPSLCRSRPHIQ